MFSQGPWFTYAEVWFVLQLRGSWAVRPLRRQPPHPFDPSRSRASGSADTVPRRFSRLEAEDCTSCEEGRFFPALFQSTERCLRQAVQRCLSLGWLGFHQAQG